MSFVTPAVPGQQTIADADPTCHFWFHPQGLRQDEIPANSHTVVWMICDEFHAYKRKVVVHNAAERGCPVCRNLALVRGVNDFATTHPEQASAFVKPGRSGRTPNTTSALSRARATWRCNLGHEFVASFGNMAQEQRNVCQCSRHKRLNLGFSDLATRNPVLAAQFDIGRNGCTPDQVDAGSRKKYWWICPAGHKFEAPPTQRMLIGPTSNGCSTCYLSSPIDPDTHRHHVDASLRPTDEEVAAYFKLRKRRYQPRPARTSPSPLKGQPRKHYTEDQKDNAVALYVRERERHRSHTATLRFVSTQLDIGQFSLNSWIAADKRIHRG